MLATIIIDAIERRRAKFHERCRIGCGDGSNEADRINLRIAEEYDALMREIQPLRNAHTIQHPPLPVFQEDRSEEWILGDQGQMGG